MHSWNTFGARTNHGQTQIHKIHHGPNLGETTTFPFIILFVLGHGACIQMSFCLGTPKIGTRPITCYVDFRLRWCLKQSYSPRWEISNSMWHATCTQVNQGDSWRLVVKSQIGILIPGHSFGHNLCLKYPNGSCEPNLDINVSRDFQWYKEFFNPMSFDPCNHPLKIRESIGAPTPKVQVHLGMWGFIPSHSLALPGHEMWFLGFTLGSHLRKPLPWSWAQS